MPPTANVDLPGIPAFATSIRESPGCPWRTQGDAFLSASYIGRVLAVDPAVGFSVADAARCRAAQ